jgi:hypothetical protein
MSPEQGSYYHPLTRAQANAARKRGWKLTLLGGAEQGTLFGEIDYPDAPQRHAMGIHRDPEGFDVARITTAVTPVIRGIDWRIPGPPGQRHELIMTRGASGESTDLWVDGQQRIRGAPGMTDYLYRRGGRVRSREVPKPGRCRGGMAVPI